jgi:intracellular septation protein A
VPTTAYLLFTIARKRRVDALGVFVLVVIAASIGISFMTGSPRFLLAKEGVFTAVIGGAFYVSLFRARPLSFVIGRALLGRITRSARVWDELWLTDAGFRRRWRISAIIWGAGMMVDAAVRVLMSYTMSVDQVPALTGTLSIATLVVLQGIDQIQLRRGGVFVQLIGAGRISEPAGRSGPDSRPRARPPAAP